MEGNNIHVGDSRRSLVMFDLVLLLVQLPSSKQVVNGLVILRGLSQPGIPKNAVGLTISKNWPSNLYSQPFFFITSATWNTCSTARGIIPLVSSETPPSIVKDLPEPV